MSNESGFQKALIALSKATIRKQKEAYGPASSVFQYPEIVVGCCLSHLGQK